MSKFEIIPIEVDEKTAESFKKHSNHMNQNYEIKHYHIKHEGKIVGWITNQYYLDNWRIFTQDGRQLNDGRKFDAPQSFKSLIDYIETLTIDDFYEPTYAIVGTSAFGMKFYITPDEYGYCHASTHFTSVSKKQMERLSAYIECMTNTNRITLTGDYMVSYEVITIDHMKI